VASVRDSRHARRELNWGTVLFSIQGRALPYFNVTASPKRDWWKLAEELTGGLYILYKRTNRWSLTPYFSCRHTFEILRTRAEDFTGELTLFGTEKKKHKSYAWLIMSVISEILSLGVWEMTGQLTSSLAQENGWLRFCWWYPFFEILLSRAQ
jgi:hypothetical protein